MREIQFMTDLLEWRGYVAGPAHDLAAIHKLVLEAEASSPANTFFSRRLNVGGNIGACAYYSAKAGDAPVARKVLVKDNLALQHLDACIVVFYRVQDSGHAICFRRGRALSEHELCEDLTVQPALQAFINVCTGEFGIGLAVLNELVFDKVTL